MTENTFEAMVKPKRVRKTDGPQIDEFCDDGVTKKLNRTRPYGVIYSAALDGQSGPLEMARFEQDLVKYDGAGIPMGYIPAAKRGLPEVAPPPVEEVLEENEQLRRQVVSQGDQIASLMKRIEALEGTAAKAETVVPRAAKPAEKARAA